MSAVYRFKVNGRVQGVGFRQATQSRAVALGLRGWVRNCDDGSMEGIAAGAGTALENLHAWLQQGPAAARVDQLAWQAAGDEAVSDGGFQIRR